MSQMQEDGFKFGIEAEFLLADANSFRPLWYRDLKFAELNELLESIPISDLPVDGLAIEPPHRKCMPFVVEGYHLPYPDYRPIDLLPKGLEIRTPIASSIEQCLKWLATLHQRLQTALVQIGCVATVVVPPCRAPLPRTTEQETA